MSEYQYVHFMALDRPLNDKQLEYMGRQSTRAEITKWEFTNEYHFGDFHGNTLEMLRRGYDVHLHFANFGIRRLMFRLPAGLPWDKKTFNAYLPEYGVGWHADSRGPGGVLEIYPESDAGTFESYQTNVEDLLDDLAPIRDLLIAGDLRPLYVIWLALTSIYGDDEATEPPLPAGMESLPDCLTALADFYELGPDMLAAAAVGASPLPKTAAPAEALISWLDQQTNDELKKLLQRFLMEDSMGVRAETLALIRNQSETAAWPTLTLNRTFHELRELGDQIEAKRLQKAAAAQAKKHAQMLKKLAADPDQVIQQVEQLIQQRSTPSYEQAVQALLNLGEALGPTDGPIRLKAEVERLSKIYSTYTAFIRVLRRHGLLVKSKR